jgi:hypothetical protein
MTLAELTQAAKKLRLRKAPLRFRPRLIYLVEIQGMYVHPSQTGLTGGQTIWADSSLWFQCHKDAADYAKTCKGAKVIKLNIAAFEEPIIRSTPMIDSIEQFQWGDTMSPRLKEEITRAVQNAGFTAPKDDFELYELWKLRVKGHAK